jgi:hypothetical protein
LKVFLKNLKENKNKENIFERNISNEIYFSNATNGSPNFILKQKSQSNGELYNKKDNIQVPSPLIVDKEVPSSVLSVIKTSNFQIPSTKQEK